MSKKNKKRKKPNYKGNQKKETEQTKPTFRLLPTGEELKKKLIPTVLLSLILPILVCVICPFEIYAANLEEFTFSLGDFLPTCLLWAAILTLVIFIVLMLLRGIAYDIGCGTVLWLSLMSFVQRTFLNKGIDALSGDGVGTSAVGGGAAALNLTVWLVVGAAIIVGIVCFRKKQAENMKLVMVVAAIALIGAQAVSFITLSFTTDVYTPVTMRDSVSEDGEIKVLTYEGIEELSSGKNVVFFLVDRFDADYYNLMVEEDPDFFDRLDGFTHFSDYTSLYCRTYPAVASILTGKDHAFEERKEDAFKEFYEDGGGKLSALSGRGYDINLYTEKKYVYLDATVMEEYVDNVTETFYYIDSKAELGKDMLRLSLSQYLPLAAKGWAGELSTPMFNSHAIYDGSPTSERESGDADSDFGSDESTEEDSISKYDEYIADTGETQKLSAYLEEVGMGKVESYGRFTFIHLYDLHDVYYYTNSNATRKVRGVFDFIYDYIDQMKALGVYDSSTIIITGDHAAVLSDTKEYGEAPLNQQREDPGVRVTAMLFKKAGDSGTPLAHSAAQISQDQLWDTIFESEGLLDAKTGESFFDIPEGEDRVRRHYFEKYKRGDMKYDELVEYQITGTAWDRENWVIIDRTDIVRK